MTYTGRQQISQRRMHMVRVNAETDAVDILWRLLQEREPHQSISHVQMPTYEEHARFVRSPPYRWWYLIFDGVIQEYVGSCYITRSSPGYLGNEIGLFIFKAHQGKGYGTWAVRWLLGKRGVSVKYANVAPTNPQAQRFWERFGFTHIQNTLRREAVDEPQPLPKINRTPTTFEDLA